MSVNKFERYSNYDKNTDYRSVVFGANTILLETELNELQQIQDTARTDLIRQMVYSGFTQRVLQGFKGENLILNPIGEGNGSGVPLKNTLLIAPFQTIINGYKIDCIGNVTYGNVEGYISVQLDKPTSTNVNDSLIYLEAWFEYATADALPLAHGYVHGNTMRNYAVDERVAYETSRRIVLRWNVRSVDNVDFSKFPEGFGYNNTKDFSAVYCYADGQFGNEANINKVFCSATHPFFIDEDFNFDNNLYVGGRKAVEVNSSTFIGNYVFALPMFRVKRRNTTPYSVKNYNGAMSQYDYINHNSINNGDLGYGFRADNLYYDKIDKDDVTDIRKTISFAEYNETSLGNETLLKLFNNNLYTTEAPRTRRVQFGNSHIDYSQYDKVTMVLPFDGTTKASKPVKNVNDVEINVLTHDIINAYYEDSIFNNGIVVNGNNFLQYDTEVKVEDYERIINNSEGTIDFYFKPYWNGSDNEDCIIFSVADYENTAILRLEKKNNKLLLTQYLQKYDKTKYNQAVLDLDYDMLVANRYYHIRISWTDTPMPFYGQMFIYINGKLMAQNTYNNVSSDNGGMIPKYFNIGSSTNSINNKGFLVEDLVVYGKRFEILSTNKSTYGFAKNTFWPMIPEDWKANNELLMLPGFNGIINNYSDDTYTQKNTVFHVYRDSSVTSENKYHLNVSNDRVITKINAIYDMTKLRKENEKSLNNNINEGYSDAQKRMSFGSTSAQGLGTSHVSFVVTDQNVTDVLVVAEVDLKSGCGGADVPLEIHKASLVEYSDNDNFSYDLNFTQEVSFNDINNKYPREVSVINPVLVNNEMDTLYDMSNSYRSKEQCFARLIKYHISMKARNTATDNMNIGGTNMLYVPQYVYGYKVCGIISCSRSKIKNVTYTYSDNEDTEVFFKVELEQILLTGETVELELATEGYSFDYDLNSKTLMTNMHKCITREFEVKYGTNDTFTITCLSDSNGIINGGILKSVFNVKTFAEDSDGDNDLNQYTYITKCFYDGETIYNSDGKVTDDKVWTMIDVEVLAQSYDSPILTLKFKEAPRKGTKIRIPLMVSYQMKASEILSMWYSYTPYQGQLDNTVQTVHRISDWNYFATTLGTGKTDEETIRLNIINNLPGGQIYGYRINNKDITLVSEADNSNYINNELNRRIVFFNDKYYKNDSELCNLKDTFEIQKTCAHSQDGLFTINNVDFNIYFEDCTSSVSKYMGAYCVVLNAEGELMLLIIGNIDEEDTIINHLKPTYGDLYRIEGRPTKKIKNA